MAISDYTVIIDELVLGAAYRFILSLAAEDTPDQESDFASAMRSAAQNDRRLPGQGSIKLSPWPG